MPLSVLHAIPSFAGGGAERQLSLLAPALSRLGIEAHVAYIEAGVNVEPLVASSVRLHQIACTNFHDPRILLRLLQLIRAVRPNLIQSWLPQMDVLAGMAAILTGTPFLLTERSSAQAYTSGWKNRLRWQVGMAATAVVANSHTGIEYWGHRPGARFVIRNGVTSTLNAPSEPLPSHPLGLPPEANVILFAGRLQIEKNVSTLVVALNMVLTQRADCSAVLFGEGPLEQALQQQILSLPTAARIHLAGYSRALPAWMRRASVFVSVSHFEGSPNVVLEAMTAQCPLVVSDIPQHHEILDPSAACFCDPSDARDIARAISDVLSNSNLATERAARAAARVNTLSIERAAREYLRLYRALLPGQVELSELETHEL